MPYAIMPVIAERTISIIGDIFFLEICLYAKRGTEVVG
jgi:hypothetical protein